MQRVRESEIPFRSGQSGVKYLFRGPNLDWGVIVMLPGECLAGHYHQQVEETFYLVEGKITLYADDVPHDLLPGDAIRLEAPERHRVINSSDAPAKLLFLKYPYLPSDKVDI